MQAGAEVVVDPVGCEELPLVALLPGLDAGRRIATKLPADEVHDTPLLRKQEAEPVEQVESVGVQRIAAEEGVLRDRPRREGRFELAISALHRRLGPRPQPHQAAAYEILDMAHGKAQRQRVAVANACQLALADAGNLLDALLQGPDDQYGILSWPFTEELEEAKVLRERRAALGLQEL